MATILNSYNCLIPGANTGIDQCAIDLKNTVGIFIMPPGTKIAAADLATPTSFLAALTSLTTAALGTRIYPVFGLIQNADATEATQFQTFPNGFKYPVRDGYYAPSYQFVANVCLYRQLRKFRNQAWDILTVDAAGTGWGVKNSDGSLSGIPADYLDVPTFKNNTGSAVAETTISLSAAPDFWDNFGFVKALTLGQWRSVKGLMTAVLGSAGARVANVSLINGGVGCGQVSLAAKYTTALNVTNLWRYYDSVSGLPVALTSVAYTSGIDGYTLTANTADANYNAANPALVSLAPPSVLTTAGITGLESTVFQTPN